MNIPRIFASAVIRRVAYLLVAAASAFALSIFTSADAHAAGCLLQTDNCDEGQAVSAAYAEAKSKPNYNSPTEIRPAPPGTWVRIDFKHGTNPPYNLAGSTAQYYYSPAKKCTARPAYYVGIVGGSSPGAPQCDAGCIMKTTSGKQGRIDMRNNSIFTGTGVASATGATCDATPDTPARTPPKDNYCTTLEGGHKLCVHKDKPPCIVSAKTNRSYCGNNDYPTIGTDPPRTESTSITSPTTSPGTPATPPAPRPGEQWTPGSSASVTNTTNNTTTNITNYDNSGTPNITPGSEVPGDGGGNNGEPGEGDGDGEGDDVGNAGPGVGELYQGSDDTLDSVVSGWWSSMQNTPILAQINTFFGNCGYSGSCPSLTYSNEWMGDLNFVQLCDGTLADIFSFAGYVVLAMGAFAAFRIAVY